MKEAVTKDSVYHHQTSLLLQDFHDKEGCHL
jgi:hypothetical protein